MNVFWLAGYVAALEGKPCPPPSVADKQWAKGWRAGKAELKDIAKDFKCVSS